MFNYFSILTSSLISRAIFTFLILHSLQWGSTLLIRSWCHEPSFTGFFRGMIEGHGPVCYTLTTISYQSQASIYQLIGLTSISSIITQISDGILGKSKES